MRGGRARAGSLPLASQVDVLNAEELAANGVRVDTLKRLSLRTPKEEVESEEGGQPPKLIPLDQVTLRGEDLTGTI